MKTIPLSKGKFAIVDDEDYEELSKYKWCAVTSGGRPYAVRTVYMHKEVLRTNDPVDHINSNSLDNCKTNLRGGTIQQNNWNTRKRKETCGKPTQSKFKGVTRHKKKFRSQIMKDSIRYRLGYFDTEEEAGRAYDAKARELFGEWAYLNFPNQ